MSRYTSEQIEEDNRNRELKMDIDYSCVQFGKWINECNAAPTNHNNMWFIWGHISNDNNRSVTTEELYQLYLNDIDNTNK